MPLPFLGVSSLDLGHAFGHGPFFFGTPAMPSGMAFFEEALASATT